MLFACENGILDLETHQFSDGRPDDCCTISCGLNYHKYNEKDDEVLEMNEFFRKVFTNVNRREYFLDAACATLEGGNVNKTLLSEPEMATTPKLLPMLFWNRPLEITVSNSLSELLIVGKGASSSGPRPELARVRGKRLGNGSRNCQE